MCAQQDRSLRIRGTLKPDMRRLLLVSIAFLLLVPASAQAGWTELVHRTDRFVTDGERHAAWEARGTLTVLDTRTGRRTATPLPAGCHLFRVLFSDENGVGVLRLPRVRLLCDGRPRVLDVRTGRLGGRFDADHWWARPACAPVRAALATAIRADGAVWSWSTAVGPRALLRVDGAQRLVLRRCHGPATVLAPHTAIGAHPRLGGGWATWASGGDPDDTTVGGPAGVVRARSLRDSRSVAVRPPRTLFTSCDGPLRGGWGWADHTANRLFWVATLTSFPEGEDCVLGAQRVFVRRLG
jgi:hypothetical protein